MSSFLGLSHQSCDGCGETPRIPKNHFFEIHVVCGTPFLPSPVYREPSDRLDSLAVLCVCVCVCASVRAGGQAGGCACVRACVRMCVRACLCRFLLCIAVFLLLLSVSLSVS